MDQAYESTGGGLVPGVTGVSLSPRIAVLDLEPGSMLLGLGLQGWSWSLGHEGWPGTGFYCTILCSGSTGADLDPEPAGVMSTGAVFEAGAMGSGLETGVTGVGLELCLQGPA